MSGEMNPDKAASAAYQAYRKHTRTAYTTTGERIEIEADREFPDVISLKIDRHGPYLLNLGHAEQLNTALFAAVVWQAIR